MAERAESPSPVSRRALLDWTARALLAGAIALGAMAASSRGAYSVVGIDSERVSPDGSEVVHIYVRLRWPGDGSVRAGLGEKRFSVEEEDVDPVDLVGRFFREPHLDQHRPFGGSLSLSDEPDAWDVLEGRHVWVHWLLAPSWVPGLMLAVAWALLTATAKRRKSLSATTPGRAGTGTTEADDR